jgi:hypothetical protein
VTSRDDIANSLFVIVCFTARFIVPPVESYEMTHCIHFDSVLWERINYLEIWGEGGGS